MGKRIPPPPAFEPYAIVDTYGVVQITRLVVAASFGAVVCIYHPLVVPGVTYGVYDTHVLEAFLPDGPYPRYRASERPLQSVLSELRQAMLEHGGTPEAVRHLINLGVLTEGDIIVAKEKLASKGKPAAAEAPAEKPAKGGKGKGNAEALAKAREAKDTGPDTRKITVLKKENPYREGSGRAASFDALKGAKTVEDYKTAGGKAKYIARWEADGVISLK